MGGPYLMGIDIGTGQSKGVLVDMAGRVAAAHIVGHETRPVAPGWFEHDAEKIWYGEFCQISRTLLEKSGAKPSDIAGVGTSAIGPCVLPVDKDGAPLRTGILYGIDTRSTAEITWLNEKYGIKSFMKTSGNLLSTQAAGPKILWLKQNQPDIYKNTAHFLTSTSYIVFRLTGQRVMDHYTAAAGYTPLYDCENQCWGNAYAGDICPPDRLPRLLWTNEVAGHVTQKAAAECGLLPGTPVTAGTADAAAEAVSVGVTAPGDAMLMFGSTVFIIALTDSPAQNPQMWNAPFLFPGSHSVLGGMGAAGSLLTWFRDELARDLKAGETTGGPNAYDELEKLAKTSPPGARGLLALPYFCGERTPLNDPLARGSFFGLTMNHTRADLYRALFESVGYGIRDNLAHMWEDGQAARVCVVGGGTKNSHWMQIVADITGLPLKEKAVGIGASYGDAFLAGLGTGLFHHPGEIDRWVQNKRQYSPSPATAPLYNAGFSLYCQLYQSTRDIAHSLAPMPSGGTTP